MGTFDEERGEVSDTGVRLCSSVTMEPIWTSVVAVAGTLLGAVVTYPFQRLAAKQQRLRDERIAAYTAFASAVEDFRWGQAERYFSKQRDPDGEATRLAYQEGHRLRTNAWQAFYRIKLVTNDADLVAHAEAALEQTRSVSGATNDYERDQLDDVAKAAIRDFVDYASKRVQ
ncbi:hypothetical protein PV350_07315 [Streptomyces sp. PA03-6a]|nr:hypothetical protein [Streptomyces sp. PA03-6a]